MPSSRAAILVALLSEFATCDARRVSSVRQISNLTHEETDPGPQCNMHPKCKDLGISVGECCPNQKGKFVACCSNKPKKAKKAKKSKRPKQKKNTDPGPLYKCETVPTFALDEHPADEYLTCQRHKYKPELPGTAKAGCFSLAPYVRWWCADKNQGPKFLDEDGMSKDCRSRTDSERNLFDGRCVIRGHKDYDQAIDFHGAIDWNRPSHTGKWQEAPKSLPLELPEEKPSGAIGWNPTQHRTALGKWCEVGVPAKGWKLGSCSSRSLDVTVLTYNLFWWKLFGQRNGAGWIKTDDGGGYRQPHSAGHLMKKNGPFDIMAFQECDDVKRILGDAGLLGSTEYYAPRWAVAIAWKKSEWKSLGNGVAAVSEDVGKPYWGFRGVIFSRLQHRKTGKIVFFMNHHGPLPDRTPGGFCGAHATAFNLLRVAAERAFPGDTIILTGDFNARAESAELAALSQHLKLVYTGTSFHGVDNFLTNCAEASETKNLGSGGSDHDALRVVFKV